MGGPHAVCSGHAGHADNCRLYSYFRSSRLTLSGSSRRRGNGGRVQSLGVRRRRRATSGKQQGEERRHKDEPSHRLKPLVRHSVNEHTQDSDRGDPEQSLVCLGSSFPGLLVRKEMSHSQQHKGQKHERIAVGREGGYGGQTEPAQTEREKHNRAQSTKRREEPSDHGGHTGQTFIHRFAPPSSVILRHRRLTDTANRAVATPYTSPWYSPIHAPAEVPASRTRRSGRWHGHVTRAKAPNATLFNVFIVIAPSLCTPEWLRRYRPPAHGRG